MLQNRPSSPRLPGGARIELSQSPAVAWQCGCDGCCRDPGGARGPRPEAGCDPSPRGGGGLENRRPHLNHRLHHAKPRVPRLRHAVRHRREPSNQTADGRTHRGVRGRHDLSVHAPRELAVLEVLGKPSSNVPFMMPARFAATSPDEQITEVVGSGRFEFAKDDWEPGRRAVYVRNPDYVPRNETPNGAAIVTRRRLESIGFNVILKAMDWSTSRTVRARKETPTSAFRAGASRRGSAGRTSRSSRSSSTAGCAPPTKSDASNSPRSL
jgi:hypothetical protein